MPTLESAHTSPTVPAVEQTRVIRASRARVYEAWTKPEILQQWFGPTNMICPAASLDVRQGGAYRIEVRPKPDPAQSSAELGSAQHSSIAEGIYTKVVPNELLQFTWIPSWQPGEESLVTVSLRDADGGTAVTIRHERFNTDVSRNGHQQGWSGSLEKLALALEPR